MNVSDAEKALAACGLWLEDRGSYIDLRSAQVNGFWAAHAAASLDNHARQGRLFTVLLNVDQEKNMEESE